MDNWEQTKASLPEGWFLDEENMLLLNGLGQVVVAWHGDKDMFRALVQDAVHLSTYV